MNELKVDNTTINNEDVTHEFNYNERLNGLLQKFCLKTDLLNTTNKYTLDYDNVIRLRRMKDMVLSKHTK